MLGVRLVMELSYKEPTVSTDHNPLLTNVLRRRQPNGAPNHLTSPPIHTVTNPQQDMYDQLCLYE